VPGWRCPLGGTHATVLDLYLLYEAIVARGGVEDAAADAVWWQLAAAATSGPEGAIPVPRAGLLPPAQMRKVYAARIAGFIDFMADLVRRFEEKEQRQQQPAGPAPGGGAAAGAAAMLQEEQQLLDLQQQVRQHQHQQQQLLTQQQAVNPLHLLTQHLLLQQQALLLQQQQQQQQAVLAQQQLLQQEQQQLLLRQHHQQQQFEREQYERQLQQQQRRLTHSQHVVRVGPSSVRQSNPVITVRSASGAGAYSTRSATARVTPPAGRHPTPPGRARTATPPLPPLPDVADPVPGDRLRSMVAWLRGAAAGAPPAAGSGSGAGGDGAAAAAAAFPSLADAALARRYKPHFQRACGATRAALPPELFPLFGAKGPAAAAAAAAMRRSTRSTRPQHSRTSGCVVGGDAGPTLCASLPHLGRCRPPLPPQPRPVLAAPRPAHCPLTPTHPLPGTRAAARTTLMTTASSASARTRRRRCPRGAAPRPPRSCRPARRATCRRRCSSRRARRRRRRGPGAPRPRARRRSRRRRSTSQAARSRAATRGCSAATAGGATPRSRPSRSRGGASCCAARWRSWTTRSARGSWRCARGRAPHQGFAPVGSKAAGAALRPCRWRGLQCRCSEPAPLIDPPPPRLSLSPAPRRSSA
jgi:hypothetical protein